MEELKAIPFYLWVIIGLILITQATWIFKDASKRGEKKWIWGLFGLINAPSNLIIYLLVTRVILKSKACTNCGNHIRETSKYCPVCGAKQDINQ